MGDDRRLTKSLNAKAAKGTIITAKNHGLYFHAGCQVNGLFNGVCPH
jgi:hypothetical protein